MSTIALTSQLAPFWAGLEKGHDWSPMAHLKMEYSEEQERLNSVHTWVTDLASKKTLLGSDIVDQSPDRPRDMPHFLLIPDSYLELHKTLSELQFFLQWAAGLLPECQAYFVDSKDTFLTILNGAYDLSQLHAACMGISKKIELEIRFMDKYELEYKEAEENRIRSPISTNPGVIQNIAQILSADQRMWYLYSQVPHHQVELTDDTLWQFDVLQHWQDMYPAPDAWSWTVKSITLPGTLLPESLAQARRETANLSSLLFRCSLL